MKNFFLTLFLLLFIFSVFLYVLFYYSFNLSYENNLLNKKFHIFFASNLLLRQLFKLHRIGDARSDYLTTNNFQKLEINIYNPNRDTFSEDFKNTLIDRIGQITNKPAGIFVKEESLNYIETITDEGIKMIIKDNPINLKNSAKLNIFLIKSYYHVPTYIGLVKDAYHIFLFSAPLEDISHFEKTSDNAYLSTILHEFSHLLGAGHVANDRCILSEKVEDIAFGRPAEITTTFCPEDLEEIKKASAN